MHMTESHRLSGLEDSHLVQIVALIGADRPFCIFVEMHIAALRWKGGSHYRCITSGIGHEINLNIHWARLLHHEPQIGVIAPHVEGPLDFLVNIFAGETLRVVENAIIEGVTRFRIVGQRALNNIEHIE